MQNHLGFGCGCGFIVIILCVPKECVNWFCIKIQGPVEQRFGYIWIILVSSNVSQNISKYAKIHQVFLGKILRSVASPAPRCRPVRERRMVHMTSDIFGGVDKSVYSTKAQKDGPGRNGNILVH